MLNIIVAIFQIIWGFGLIGFWIYFFLVENKNPARTEVYLVFEKSFVLADLGWVMPCYFISAFGLLTNQSFWIFFSIAAGSAHLFLFLMDFSFNIQQGTYKNRTPENMFEMIINILSLIFAPLFMIYAFLNL